MRSHLSLAIVSFLGINSVASAQPQPFTNTPTNPPPLGGQLPQGVVGRDSRSLYTTPLYQMGDVGRHLNLSPDQMSNISSMVDETRRMRDNEFANVNRLDPVQRQARMDQLNQQYLTNLDAGARKIMNDTQWARYQQLQNQYLGFDALANSDIQKRMNLTPAQIERLNTQRIWNNDQLREINRVAATDPTRAAQLHDTYLKERSNRIAALLTPAQQQDWIALTGDPYTFKPQFLPQK